MRDHLSTSVATVSRRGIVQSLLGALAAAPALVQAAAPPRGRGDPVTGAPRSADELLASLGDGVFINANESPLGPCPAARAQLARIPSIAGRYGMSFAADLEALFASQNGLKPENVTAHPGSYVPLRHAALTYASDSRPLAYCTPTFDSGFFGADNLPIVRTVTIPHDKQHRIDVRALLAAAPNAGAYYICNPNNPTGLVTSPEDIAWLLANKPADAKLIIDEAYIHFSDAPSAIELVRQGRDVIVLRTFSKIYGLAGLRCGLVIARKDLLEPMKRYGVNVMPMAAVAAAQASLADPELLPMRKAYNARVRDDLYAFFERLKLEYIPSRASFAMVNVGRPGTEVAAKLAEQRIHVSRQRGNMVNWIRVSFGTPDEMAAFKAAFERIMA